MWPFRKRVAKSKETKQESAELFYALSRSRAGDGKLWAAFKNECHMRHYIILGGMPDFMIPVS